MMIYSSLEGWQLVPLSAPLVPLRRQSPIEKDIPHRTKAVGRNSRQKAIDQQQGSFGTNPSNDNLVREPLSVWLVERPPIKPGLLGIPLSGGTRRG